MRGSRGIKVVKGGQEGYGLSERLSERLSNRLNENLEDSFKGRFDDRLAAAVQI
jgi:hypothetical protein